jgi:SNF2 family DNA or RNA helicase
LQHVASNGIMHAIDPVPLKLIQTEGRLDRIGQKEPIQWTYMALRDSADELVIHLAVEKLDQFRESVPGATNTGLSDALAPPAVSEEDAKKALQKLYAAL